MALSSVVISLSASSLHGVSISDDVFLARLSVVNEPAVLEIRKSKAAWQSAVVVLASKDVGEFQREAEPDDAFQAAIKSSLTAAAEWLGRQPPQRFDEMRRDGLVIDIFVNGWIDGDQFDLTIPPEFLLECGKRGLPIRLCTND